MKQVPEDRAWRAYRASLTLRADRNEGRARLVFREIVGRAEVWLDGVKLGEKTDAAPGLLSVVVPQGPASRTLTVLLESSPGESSGIFERVVVERGAP